jgi:plastocyanin
MVLRILAAAYLVAAALPVPGRLSAHRSTGTIDGTVTLHLRPPRRLTGRYPGAAPTPHAVQSLPAVAYLKGRIAGAPPAPPARDPVMMQHDTAFVPPALVIPVGTTVSFPNDDPFFHNVFSYSRTKRFDLGRYPKGQAKQVTFNEPGVVKVYCEVHNFMRAIIVVTENPFAAVVADDGSFHIEGVPPGTYTLVIWHADLGEVEQSVVVPADGAVHVKAELG